MTSLSTVSSHHDFASIAEGGSLLSRSSEAPIGSVSGFILAHMQAVPVPCLICLGQMYTASPRTINLLLTCRISEYNKPYPTRATYLTADIQFPGPISSSLLVSITLRHGHAGSRSRFLPMPRNEGCLAASGAQLDPWTRLQTSTHGKRTRIIPCSDECICA